MLVGEGSQEKMHRCGIPSRLSSRLEFIRKVVLISVQEFAGSGPLLTAAGKKLRGDGTARLVGLDGERCQPIRLSLARATSASQAVRHQEAVEALAIVSGGQLTMSDPD